MNDISQIKSKAVSGFIWSITENSGSYFLTFLIGLVLIRLIEPVSYGIINMMTFFVVFGTTFTDFGLSTALIQKKDPSDEDFSTVFWSNIFISVIVYLLIFAGSEIIAGFYNQPLIIFAIKIFALNFVISAFGVVHTTKISRTLNYKLWTRINLTSLIISGFTAIILAWYGMGMWALIFIQLIQNLSNTIQLWLLSDWEHGFAFSFQALKELFKFSKSILLINSINNIYSEIYSVLIGRFFGPTNLAFYKRGRENAEIFALQFTLTMSKIMLPVFSNLQDNKEALRRAFHKVLIITGFINFSVLAFLMGNGDALFVLLYTDKWISAVPYFKLLCIDVMFLPIQTLAGNLLVARGKTKKYMYIEISKRVLQAVIIYFTIDSIFLIIYGQLTVSVIFTVISLIIVKNEIGYNFRQQLGLLLKYASIAISIFTLNILSNLIFKGLGYLPQIFLNLILSLILYISIGFIFKPEAFLYIKGTISEKFNLGKR